MELDLNTAIPISTPENQRTRLVERFRKGEFKFIEEDKCRYEIGLAKEFLQTLIAHGCAKKQTYSNSAYYDAYRKILLNQLFNHKRMISDIQYGKKVIPILPMFEKKSHFFQWFEANLLNIKQD
jgi:hypothetical protein